MSDFKEIAAQIQKEIESNTVTGPITVAEKGSAPLDNDGDPIVVKLGVKGTVLSRPGTEVVTMDASSFQLLECLANVTGRDKPRYAIIEKGKVPQYGNHYATAGGVRAHIITREVYMLLLSVFKNTAQQLHTLSDKAERADEQRDLYKLTIDALRKNGVID